MRETGNVDFFKKNGYLLRGELKDGPKGHNCYELYKKVLKQDSTNSRFVGTIKLNSDLT